MHLCVCITYLILSCLFIPILWAYMRKVRQKEFKLETSKDRIQFLLQFQGLPSSNYASCFSYLPKKYVCAWYKDFIKLEALLFLSSQHKKSVSFIRIIIFISLMRIVKQKQLISLIQEEQNQKQATFLNLLNYLHYFDQEASPFLN